MTLPDHVERAEEHTKNLFNWLKGDSTTINKYLFCSLSDMDWEVAWDTFNPIAYRAIFKHTTGGVDELHNPNVTSALWVEILDTWPEKYYMEMLVKKNIAYRFEEPGETIYGLKSPHQEKLSILLTAKSTK